MRTAVAFATKELVELSPVAIVGLVVGAALGAQYFVFDGTTINVANILVMWAAAFGAWQGLLDRRFRSNEFLRHRPGAGGPAQVGRWIAGLSVIALMFVAYVVAHRIAAGMMDPAGLAEERRMMVTRWTYQSASWSIFRWSVVFAFAAWATLRVTVSWPGIVAPLVLSALSVIGLLGYQHQSLGPLAGVLLFVLFSASQVFTLGRPRVGGAS